MKHTYPMTVSDRDGVRIDYLSDDLVMMLFHEKFVGYFSSLMGAIRYMNSELV